MGILRLVLSALPTTAAGYSGGAGGTAAMGSTVGTAGARVVQEQHISVPPDVVRGALSVLEEAHKGRGLFQFPPYLSVWLPVMLTDAVKGLTEGLHPLMKEEVGLLVFNMAEVRRCTHDLACRSHEAIDLISLKRRGRSRRVWAGPDS